MTEESVTREEVNPEVVNLIDSQVESIKADLVRTTRTYVGNMNAEEVELYQAAAFDVHATQLNANSSILGICQDESSVINNSILLTGKSINLETSNSIAGGIISESTALSENTKVGVLVSGQVTAEKINTFLLVARNVEGPVETSLDTKQVAIAGILAGIASGLVLLLGKVLFRRK